VATIINHLDAEKYGYSSALPDQAHVVQFYTRDDYLLNGLGVSLGHALKSGESVVAVMTKPHRKGLLKRFSLQGIDVEEAMDRGQLTLLDASETLDRFMSADGPDRQRFLREIGGVLRKAELAAEVKHKRVVVFGEMVAVLWKNGKEDAAIRLEQLWNELAKTHFFHLHCAYPAKWFKGKRGGEPYATICGEHSVVIPA
jgi:hypothetical protein